jgi:hypothetical protein
MSITIIGFVASSTGCAPRHRPGGDNFRRNWPVDGSKNGWRVTPA